MTQYNGPQDPTQWDGRQPSTWSGQPPHAGGPYPPVPPGPAPKKGNWFARHKILTGLFGLIAVIVIGTTASAGGQSAPQADSSAAAASGPASSTTTSATTSRSRAAEKSTANAAPKATRQAAARRTDTAPGIGTPVTSGDLQFTVTKVVRDQRQVGQDFMAQKAQGRYTLVYVTVRNVGSGSETLLDSDQKVKDADSKTYSPDSMAELAMDNNNVWLEQINPGNAVDGVLVYDMPVGVRATAIDFSAGLFDSAKTVQLR